MTRRVEPFVIGSMFDSTQERKPPLAIEVGDMPPHGSCCMDCPGYHSRHPVCCAAANRPPVTSYAEARRRDKMEARTWRRRLVTAWRRS